MSETGADKPEEKAPSPRDPRLAAKIANRLTRRDLTPGIMAELRRIDPNRPVSQHFWEIALDNRLTSYGDSLIPYWARIVQEIAQDTKVGENETTGPHQGNTPLGLALAEAGYSEIRIRKLLNSGHETLPDTLRHTARFLASKQQQFNWNDMARLHLTRLRSKEEQDQDRMRIAEKYYEAKYAKEKQA